VKHINSAQEKGENIDCYNRCYILLLLRLNGVRKEHIEMFKNRIPK